MAKNEAKIKFTAETGEFNQAIKKSNNELTELRAELKLNETQMQNNGKSIEGLEKKHKLLKSQLEAATDKTDALAGKLKTAEKYFGENSDEASKLRTQLTNAKTAQAKLEQAVSDCATELQTFSRRVEDAGDAQKKTESRTEKLTREINDQRKELEDLKDEYSDATLKYGKHSKEARGLARDIGKLSSELGTNQTKLGKAQRAADKLDKSFDDVGSAADKAAEGFDAATVAVGNLISDSIQAGLGKISEFVDYLAGLPKETRESRQSMAVLSTSFDEAGLSADQGKKIVRDLYGVLGDNDRAVEASTLIAKMSDNQEDLNAWTLISTGIFGSYGESLPVESLAEAANETAKTGTVTGTLADALNWSSDAATMFSKYMSDDVTTAEDAFNVALSECTTEQERQSLITETLTALYGDAAVKYRDSAGGMIEANTAAYDLAQTENQVATAVEPVTTAWDGLKNKLLTAALPAIESVSGGLTDGLTWLKEHPTVLNAVAAGFAALAIGLGIVAIAWGIYTIVQWAANAAMLPVIGIALGIVLAIAAVVAIGVLLYQNWDTICVWAQEKWAAIKEAVSTAIDNVKTAVSEGWEAIKSWTSEKFEAVKSKASEIWGNIKTSVSDAIEGAKTTVTEAVNGIKAKVAGAFTAIKLKATTAWNNIKRAITKPIEEAKAKVKSVIDAIKGFFDFEFSWPHIPMPHFGISPEGWKAGDLLQGVIPKLGVTWYAEGGIMTKPTAFGMNGNNLMVGGEAGPEAILPIDKLEQYVSDAMERKMSALNLQALANSIEDLASRPIQLNINGRQFAVATAGDGDSVNGLRTTFKSRGLALD